MSAALVTREHHTKVAKLIKAIRSNLPTKEIKYNHYFIDGVYGREMYMDQGDLIAGRILLVDSIMVLSYGTMMLFNEGKAKLVSAPLTVKAKAGTQRVGYAVTPCTVITFIKTDVYDPVEAYDKYSTEDPEIFYTLTNQIKESTKCLSE